MAYTPASRTGRRLIITQLPGRRGEPLVQGPGALLRERPVQLLTGCAAAEVLGSQRANQWVRQGSGAYTDEPPF
jgi:hypothetical protein